MVDTEWLEQLIKPLKVSETVSRNVRLLVYAYLDTKEIVFNIACLSKTERKRMVESYLANNSRQWKINFDSFNPCQSNRYDRLFAKLQYILNVVFYVDIFISTEHGIENLCIFIEDMPEKFEREKIDVYFKRVTLQGSLNLAARIRALRPNLTFRKMSLGVDSVSAQYEVPVLDNKAHLARQMNQVRFLTLKNLVFHLSPEHIQRRQ